MIVPVNKNNYPGAVIGNIRSFRVHYYLYLYAYTLIQNLMYFYKQSITELKKVSLPS